jgi:signal transduction histidine kinase
MNDSLLTMAVEQFRDIANLCDLAWVVRLESENGRWLLPVTYGLNNSQHDTLLSFLDKPGINTWLAGGLASGRLRWRGTGTMMGKLGCKKIYLFPIGRYHGGLLIGVDELNSSSKKFLTILTRRFLPSSSQNQVSTWLSKTENLSQPPEGEFSYNPHNALERIVQDLAEETSCDQAYLAVRSGNFFTIKADWKCEGLSINRDLSIQAVPPLRTMVNTHRGLVLRGKALDEVIGQLGIPSVPAVAWMGVPILFGQQVIGLVAFLTAQQEAFTTERLDKVYAHANRLAYSIENAIVFAEAGRYLQQMALLNELATTVALGMEINEVARRIMQRLRRVFNIDWASVFLLSPDGTVLREYGGEGRRAVPLTLPVETTLVGTAVTSGLPVRDNNLVEGKHYQPAESGLHSEMAVPLKYQGKVIGAIDLMSTEFNTFSNQDEQLLVLISSHLAGLLENMRLSNETQERAKKLQETVRQLEESQRALIQAEKMAIAGRLTASIAHEINNPLQAVQNCLHLANHRQMPPDQRQNYLELAQSELERLMKTVQQMLDFYRPGAVDRKPTDLHTIIQKVLILMEKQILDRQVIVSLSLAEEFPYVLVVADQIQQVFLNLVLNSIEAMPAGGEIDIKTRKLGEEVEIIFQDNGPGVPTDRSKQIFEPFISTKEHGTGLGLAVSYGIIAAHGGSLELVDNNRPGACFRIQLPVGES